MATNQEHTNMEPNEFIQAILDFIHRIAEPSSDEHPAVIDAIHLLDLTIQHQTKAIIDAIKSSTNTISRAILFHALHTSPVQGQKAIDNSRIKAVELHTELRSNGHV